MPELRPGDERVSITIPMRQPVKRYLEWFAERDIRDIGEIVKDMIKQHHGLHSRNEGIGDVPSLYE